MDLPQCSQCLRPQEAQELKEAYQLPVTSDGHCLGQVSSNALSKGIVSSTKTIVINKN